MYLLFRIFNCCKCQLSLYLRRSCVFDYQVEYSKEKFVSPLPPQIRGFDLISPIFIPQGSKWYLIKKILHKNNTMPHTLPHLDNFDHCS